MTKFLAISRSDVVFMLLINVKMSTIVSILTFMSRIILCSVELSMKKVSYPRGQVSYFIHFPRLLQQNRIKIICQFILDSIGEKHLGCKVRRL